MLEATARAEDRHFWFRGLRRNARLLLEDALQGRRGLAIVDCGSGTGRNLDWLNAYGDAFGVEQSLVGLAEGRRHGRRMVQGSVTGLPLRDASMDLATSFDVLYCLEDADEVRAVEEMRRVLKPGGLALFNVAALDLLHGSHSALTMEKRRYTRARLRGRLTAGGLSPVRMTFTNTMTFPLTLAARLADRWRGQAEVASDADLQVPAAPINAVLSAAVAVDAALMRIMDLPVGTSIMCVARRLD